MRIRQRARRNAKTDRPRTAPALGLISACYQPTAGMIDAPGAYHCQLPDPKSAAPETVELYRLTCLVARGNLRLRTGFAALPDKDVSLVG